jgi:hypothetical protein
MTLPSVRVALLCAALGLCACGGPKDIRLVSGPELAAPLPSLALAPSLLLAEQERSDPWEAFHQGYELMPEEDNQVRSVNVEFSEEPAYAEQIRLVVDQSFAALLDARGASWRALDQELRHAAVSPRRVPLRGTGPFDGRDNQNLPRFDLQPQAIDPASLPELPAGTQAILVPFIVHYYTHNGGWFVGQNVGCAAGARLRVLWSLHDASDGRVLTWGEVGVQHQQEYHYSPNKAELQDYQLVVEAALRQHLDEQLPR